MKTVFCIAAILCLFGATQMYAQPKIQIEGGKALDMGDVYTGQKAERVLVVKNVGTDTLRISEVRAQCGCTAAMMGDADKKLAPNATGKLSISFNTSNYGGSKVSKQVYISSNDTSDAKVTVTFTTNVINVVDLDPKQFTFDNMKLDSTYTKTLTIKNPSPKNPLKILSLETKFPMLKVTLMKNQLMPGETTQIQAVWNASKTGTFQGTIQMVTDNANQPKSDINFYAWVNKK